MPDDYQINGEEHVLRWATDQHADAFEAMLAWLVRLSIDPVGVSTARLDRRGVPGFVAHVPHTDAYVDYTVVEQYKTVMILDVRSTRLDDMKEDFS